MSTINLNGRWPILALTLLLIVMLGISTRLQAQDEAPAVTKLGGNWSTLQGSMELGKGWMIRQELHYRSAGLVADDQQLLIRPSVHYLLSRSFSASAGYTLVYNYDYEGAPRPGTGLEHQIYEDIDLRQTTGKWTFHHRYRFEQRFIKAVRGAVADFRHRFRYRFTMSYAFAERQNGLKLEAYFFNELFLNLFNDFRTNGFDRDWTGLGIVYPISTRVDLLAGVQQNWTKRTVDYELQRALTLMLHWHVSKPEAE